jgi:hypothetical protein
MNDERLEQRVQALEQKAAWASGPLRQPPLPAPGTFSYELMIAQQRKQDEAQAAREAEALRRQEEAEVAEAERQRRWEAWRPHRERALAALDRLAQEIAQREREASQAEYRCRELYEKRNTLRRVAQRFGKPIGA